MRPAKLWNDTESATDAAWLLGRLDGGAAGWAEACGSVPVASFTITKLSWLHRTEPASWERLAHVVLPHDWLTYQLTGRLVTDRGDASGTGYWSPAAGAYRFDLLGIVDGERDWTDVVPEVLGPSEPAGEWRGAVVAPGHRRQHGRCARASGCGPAMWPCRSARRGRCTRPAPRRRPIRRVRSPASPSATGRFLPLVCTLNATKVTEAVRRLLGVDHGAFDDLALGTPAGARGLTLLPYLDGERTPNRPDATGVLAGLRADVDRADLARASVEGVVCGLLDGLDALAAWAPCDGRLIVVGGGARSRGVPLGARRPVRARGGRAAIRRAGRRRRVRAGGGGAHRR